MEPEGQGPELSVEDREILALEERLAAARKRKAEAAQQAAHEWAEARRPAIERLVAGHSPTVPILLVVAVLPDGSCEVTGNVGRPTRATPSPGNGGDGSGGPRPGTKAERVLQIWDCGEHRIGEICRQIGDGYSSGAALAALKSYGRK